MHSSRKICISLFMEIIFYFLISKVRAIFQVYYFVMTKYKRNIVFINIKNLIKFAF